MAGHDKNTDEQKKDDLLFRFPFILILFPISPQCDN